MNLRAQGKKAVRLGVLMVVVAAMLSGCVPKEIRTAKIEMGTVKKPRANPDLDRVKKNLEQALKLYPDNGEVYHLWGRIYAMEGKYADMDIALARSEELDPKFKEDNDLIRQVNWEELFNRGKNFSQSDNLEAALESFKNSAICWSERYESLVNGAVVAHQLGRNEEAYDLSRKAYEIAPDTMIVLENYATMSMANNKYNEAETVYQRILEKDPTNAEVLFQLGNIYRVRDDTTVAVDYYSRALEIDKDNTDGWFNLGLLYFHQKDFCMAAECFGRVTTLIPEDIDARVNYLLSLVQCGKLEIARTELEKFTMEYPDNCDGWDLLSQTYLRLKMKKEASEAFKKFEDCKGE